MKVRCDLDLEYSGVNVTSMEWTTTMETEATTKIHSYLFCLPLLTGFHDLREFSMTC